MNYHFIGVWLFSWMSHHRHYSTHPEIFQTFFLIKLVLILKESRKKLGLPLLNSSARWTSICCINILIWAVSFEKSLIQLLLSCRFFYIIIIRMFTFRINICRKNKEEGFLTLIWMRSISITDFFPRFISIFICRSFEFLDAVGNIPSTDLLLPWNLVLRYLNVTTAAWSRIFWAYF